jgi:hypothetical protein
MPKTNTAPFAQTLKTRTAAPQLAVANASTDTPGNVVLLLTAGSEGALMTRLRMAARTNTSANNMMLFRKNSGDTAVRLINARTFPSVTFSTTSAPADVTFGEYTENTPMRLEAGDQLWVGAGVANSGAVVFDAEFTDF